MLDALWVGVDGSFWKSSRLKSENYRKSITYEYIMASANMQVLISFSKIILIETILVSLPSYKGSIIVWDRALNAGQLLIFCIGERVNTVSRNIFFI